MPYFERPQFNCTIAPVIQGEWYSREKNLDTVTIIDATHMRRTGGVTSDGVCIESTTDYSSNYTFLFADNPEDRASCFYCIRMFARTVNIIEKIESESVMLR